MRLVLIVAVFVAANRAYPSIDDLAARARAWVASQTPDDFLPYAGLTSSQFAWIPTLLPGAVDGVSRLSTVRSSMEGLRTVAIARAFGCYPQTVRECLPRFNVEGLDGLGDRPDSGPSRARPRPSRRDPRRGRN